MRVLLVDDHAVVRKSLAHYLSAQSDIEVVGEAADGEMAVEMARELTPDVILMDVSMPIMNGIDATRLIHGEFPDIRIIGLSVFDPAARMSAMMSAGAAGYVSKAEAPEMLLAVMRAPAEQRSAREN